MKQKTKFFIKSKFKIIAIIVLLAGISLWGFVIWNAYNLKFLKLGGSSDMLMRIQAINEAIKKGEKTYSFEAFGGPPMGQNFDFNNENSPSVLPEKNNSK